MRVLLDTQAIIWFYESNESISETAMSTILDPSKQKVVSPASYWEIAIKLSLGKYVFAETFDDFIQHRSPSTGLRKT